MVSARQISATLLNAVTTTGASSEADFTEMTQATFFITAASVTSGGTMKIQAKAPTGAWFDVDSRTIVTNGDTVVSIAGAFAAVRANLSARTDGTYTVSVFARP